MGNRGGIAEMGREAWRWVGLGEVTAVERAVTQSRVVDKNQEGYHGS